MSPLSSKYQVSLADAMAKLPGLNGARFAAVLTHGSLLVEIYAPRGGDTQTQHTRDELYLIVGGTGILYVDGRRSHFRPGDILFVPAGVDHRFENFSDDLVVWVVFYGPEGGEAGLY